MPKAKTPLHYLDNERFTAEVTKYSSAARDAIESGDLPDPMNDYIGQSILDIATKMSNRGNFSGYSYRDEMVSDGIEDCVKYLKNFDPAKAANGKPSAFSYVSRIIWFAFLRRMGKEEKQHNLKQTLIYSAGIIEEIADLQGHDDTIYENQYLANLKSMADDYYNMIQHGESETEDDYRKPSEVRNIPIPDTPEKSK